METSFTIAFKIDLSSMSADEPLCEAGRAGRSRQRSGFASDRPSRSTNGGRASEPGLRSGKTADCASPTACTRTASSRTAVSPSAEPTPFQTTASISPRRCAWSPMRRTRASTTARAEDTNSSPVMEGRRGCSVPRIWRVGRSMTATYPSGETAPRSSTGMGGAISSKGSTAWPVRLTARHRSRRTPLPLPPRPRRRRPAAPCSRTGDAARRADGPRLLVWPPWPL